MSDKPPKLTIKQQRFCEEYVAQGNAIRAYMRAFGAYTRHGKKRSYTVAARLSCLLLKRPHIAEEIASLRETYAEHACVSVERLNLADAQAAFLDISKFTAVVNGETVAVMPHDLPPEVRTCVKKLKIKRRKLRSERGDDTVSEIEEIEYDLIDPSRAREALAKRLGFDKPETTLEQLLTALSPDLRAQVFAQLRPLVDAKRVGIAQ